MQVDGCSSIPITHRKLAPAFLRDNDDDSDSDSHNYAPDFSPLSDMEFENFELFSEDSSCDDTHDVQAKDNEADSNDSEVQQTDDDDDSLSGQEDLDPTQADSSWNGFKIVGDNIDKNIKPSFQRHEIKGKSLHYFHSYAVKDRVDLSSLSDTTPEICDPDPSMLVPCADDISCILKEIEILLSRYNYVVYNCTIRLLYACMHAWFHIRIMYNYNYYRVIVQHMEGYKDQATKIIWHIQSKQNKEMALKSLVVI